MCTWELDRGRCASVFIFRNLRTSDVFQWLTWVDIVFLHDLKTVSALSCLTKTWESRRQHCPYLQISCLHENAKEATGQLLELTRCEISGNNVTVQKSLALKKRSRSSKTSFTTKLKLRIPSLAQALQGWGGNQWVFCICNIVLFSLRRDPQIT